MTDDLKHKLEQLVADPPPPSAVPSQAVFDRIRTAKRRRTTGALTLAAAAVAAVAVAAGNLADVNSSPPISNTPSAPVTVVTGPPTSTPSATPSSTPPAAGETKATRGTTQGPTSTQGATTGAPRNTSTKGAEQPVGATTTTTTTTPPVQPPERPIAVDVVLKPTVTGRTVSVKVTVSGTVIVPVVDGKNLSADTSFLNLSRGTNYYWGDGAQGGSDGGEAGCGGKTRKTGRETYSIETHTYAKPGTYTLRYEVSYCNTKGGFTTTKTAKVTIK